MEQWYVVYTHPRSELLAQAHLERQGFTGYCPRIGATRRHARRTERVSVPLFPRYLFVNLDREGCRWLAVRSTIGVHSLVSRGAEPLPLPSHIMDQIRSREDDDGLIRLNDSGDVRCWAAGTPVRIEGGAFADCTGLFQHMSDQDRVVVLLDLLGRRVKASVPREAVFLNA